METEAGGDTSGSDGGGGGGGRAARQQDSAQSVSGVTEAGTSGNAAGEKARRRHGGEDDDGLLTVVEKAVEDDDDDVDWEVVGEVTTADGDDDAVGSSPVRRTAARLGWLLLGFLAGAAVAAAVLFVMRHEHPVTCTVVPT